MEKNGKEKNGLVILLIVIIVVLLVMCGLFATGTIGIKFNDTNKDTDTNIVDKNEDNDKIESKYDVNNYIIVEEEQFEHDDFDVKKINFKNLDSNLTQKFLEKQEDSIEQAHNYDLNYENIDWGKTYTKTNKLFYQINDSILTVYYEMEFGASYAYTGCVIFDTLNIDLDNNKLLSNEEVLKLANGSFEEIANEEYERELKFLKEDTERYFMNWEQEKINYEKFKNSKDNYISLILGKLENVINAYIEDDTVKYEYIPISLSTTYMQVGKGGCFAYDTVIIGKIK